MKARLTVSAAALAAALSVVTVSAGASPQPYAGQEDRPIASLSAQDIDDLLAGRGWGFAKPAELNGYPGPAHVLDLSDELNLTAAQREAIKDNFDRMQAEAKVLGAEYVAAERRLSEAFRAGAIDADSLAAMTAEADAIRGRLRAVHLAAHLEIRPLLSHHQVVLYDRLRGYAGGGQAGHGGHSHD